MGMLKVCKLFKSSSLKRVEAQTEHCMVGSKVLNFLESL